MTQEVINNSPKFIRSLTQFRSFVRVNEVIVSRFSGNEPNLYLLYLQH